MKINGLKYLIVAITAACASSIGFAQEYDDIYYNPSKSTKTKTTTSKSKASASTTPAEYAAAGSYTGDWNVLNTRDVDEYNRRYQSADTAGVDTALVDDNFAYTRRIERFHNPDVVVETGNEDLIDWYYNQPEDETSSVVNIYVNNDPWYWGYGYPYYSWYRPYYRTWGWYAGYWGPSWSWSWGYDPWYSWGYGPGWGWSTGPSWGWHPGPGRPVAGNWRPTSPGATRPHGATTAGGRGHYAGNAISRPGNMGRPSASQSGNHNSTSPWMRPGNMGRPSASNSSSHSGNQRPGNMGRPSASASSPSSSRHDYNSSSSSSSRPGYNSSSSSSRPSYNSSGSFGGSRPGAGSGFGGSRGGSSHGGGFGGGRGGRR